MTVYTNVPQNVVSVGSGAPTDATFAQTNPTSSQQANNPADGTLYVDSVSGSLYIRTRGAWQLFKPTTAADPFSTPSVIAESFDRRSVATDAAAALATGTITLAAVELPAGITVNQVQFLAGATPESGGSHAWTILTDSARIVRAVSADATGTAAVGASALYGTAFTTPYVTPTAGIYYAGMCVVGTVPSLISATVLAALQGLAPKLAGASSTGQTTPPATGGSALTAITAGTVLPYVQVS